jgi:hypothetical protein
VSASQVVDPEREPFTDNEIRLRDVSDNIALDRALDEVESGHRREAGTVYLSDQVEQARFEANKLRLNEQVFSDEALAASGMVRGGDGTIYLEDETHVGGANEAPSDGTEPRIRRIGDVKDDLRYLRGAGAFDNEDGKAELRLLARELVEMGHNQAAWDLYAEISG